MPRTDASESSSSPYLPTPDSVEGGNRGGSQHPDKRALTNRTINLADVVEHTLPTPKIKDRAKRGPGATGGPDLGEAVQLLNSPTSSDGTGVGAGRRKESTLRGQVDQLVPTPTAKYAARSRTSGRSFDAKPVNEGTTLADFCDLLPTPRTGSNRNSRKGLVPEGHSHWAAPALEQVTDFLDGELPREYASADEVKGAARELLDLLPTPTPTDMGERKSVEEFDEWQSRMADRHGTGGHGRSLDVEARRLMPTPSTAGGGERTRSGDHSDELLLAGVAEELFPTPSAHDGESGADLPNRDGGPSLTEVTRLMPTPRATDGTNGGPNQRGTAGDLALPSAALQLMPTPDAQMGGAGGRSGHPDDARDRGHHVTINEVAQNLLNWGPYEPAIQRWESVLGRVAPWATEPSPRSKKGRLAPRFVEWMMGWPEGWVTLLKLSRNAQLKILGNGVVPQQASEAVRFLLAPPPVRESKRPRKVVKRASPRGMLRQAGRWDG